VSPINNFFPTVRLPPRGEVIAQPSRVPAM
jgi:hypothetical protein